MIHSNSKLQYMVRLSIFTALEIVLALTPLGYLSAGIIEISFMMVPVVVSAMILGPAAGAFLGGVFGLTSFLQCFGTSPFGSALLAINGFYTFLVCVPTRILAGWLAGLLFRLLITHDKTKFLSYVASSLAGALLNTLLFMSTLILLFGKTDVVGFVNSGKNFFLFLAAFVGTNALVEAVACTVLGAAIGKALAAALSRGKAK